MIFSILFLLGQVCYSQNLGCQRGNTVYTQQGLLGVWGGSALSTLCPPNAILTMTHAGNIVPLPGPQTCNINVLSAGILVHFDIVNCSLDKYVFLLILPIALVAASMIRKRL